jgi:hypothetical protein
MPATMVFSHPNHEAAVLGTISRLRPHIIYLTDGGADARVAETKQALRSYQPASVHYLNHSEPSFYDALLGRDVPFFRAVSAEIRGIVQNLDSDAVYCDAVEFYNPVHDVTLPVVRAALAGYDFSVFEVPLIYQKAGPVEAFELQHVPASLANRGVWLQLTEEELAQKASTVRAGVYTMLFAQLGTMLLDALPSRGGCESFLKARNTLPSPAPEQVLRYETRGSLLKDAGAVRDVITFAGHYAPIFESLCGARSRVGEEHDSQLIKRLSEQRKHMRPRI